MQKKDVTCKNRRDREKKSVLPVFFLTGGRNEKMHRKRSKKKVKKYVKNSLHFRGQNAIL
mgnify:CR=1 FL=1